MKIAVVCANGKAGKLIVKEAVDRGLDVNPEHTACVADGPDFPDAFKPLAAAMAKALGELRQRGDVKWTYISPAGDFQADGARTGKYILGEKS